MVTFIGLKTTPSQVVSLDFNLVEDARWIGDAGDQEVSALTYHPGLNVSPINTPSKIISLDRSPGSLKVCQRHSMPIGEGPIVSLFAGINMFLAPQCDPGIIKKTDIIELTEISRWTGIAGETVNCMAFYTIHGISYIFAGLNTTPASVVKIRISDMVEVDRWVGGAGDSNVLCIVIATSGYIGIGLQSNDLVKLSPTTMNEISRYIGASDIVSITGDGTSFYASSDILVLKVHQTTMALTASWNAGAPTGEIKYGLGSILCCLRVSPATVVKINRTTMLETLRWTGNIGDGQANCIDPQGFTYIGLESKTLVKLNITTMTEVVRWTGLISDAGIISVSNTGVGIWASIDLNPGIMVPIIDGYALGSQFMLERAIWQNVSPNKINCLKSSIDIGPTPVGLAGINSTPAQVVKYIDLGGAMLELSRWNGGFDTGPVISIFSTGFDAYIGLSTGQIIKLDTPTMTEIGRWTGADSVLDMSVLAGEMGPLYAVLDKSNGTVVKIDTVTMTEIDRFVGLSGEIGVSVLTDVGFILLGGSAVPVNYFRNKSSPLSRTGE